MYKYENGMVRANTETAMLLEEILNTKITLDIDLFEPYQEDIKLKADTSNLNQTQGTNAQNLAKLGFGVVSTNKSPFDALAKAEIATRKKEQTPLIANLNVQDEQNTRTLKKMAISLKDLSLVTSSDPFFVLKDDKIKIKSWEMKEVENSKEFLRLIRERRLIKIIKLGENMDFQKNRGMIILIVALILAAILTFYVGVKNPIILGLGILAIIVIAINIYIEKIRK